MLQHVNGSTKNPTRRRKTVEDVLALPDDVYRADLIDGEIYVQSYPSHPHQFTVSIIGARLVIWFQLAEGGPGGWWILPGSGLHLGEDVLVPDLVGWRRERLPELPPPDTRLITLAPDWACEVLSPSTTRIDRKMKLPVFAREGVKHVWLIDPIKNGVEIYALEGSSLVLRATHGGDERIRAVPFEAIEVSLSELWIRPAAAVQPSRRT